MKDIANISLDDGENAEETTAIESKKQFKKKAKAAKR